jgi:hypothetical protein
MSASGPRFCPNCGTERVRDMRFCSNCGLDLGQIGSNDRSPAADPAPASEVAVAAPATLDREARPERSTWRLMLGPALLVLFIAVAATWFVGIGPFAREGGGTGPLDGGGPGPAPTSPFLPAITALPSFAASPGLTAPPVGLTILSPADGAVVGTREVTVIGTAPPGLRITQDISFGFDRHAMADGTGHWAIGIELNEGENQLRFRIGDDPSTTQTMRVTYVAPAAP